MKYFVTADQHFGHENIISHCNRPFKDVKEMDETLIKNWNEIVGEEDTVFQLGDFSLGNTGIFNYYKNRLNGNIIFIRGNHDSKKAGIMKMAVIEYLGRLWVLTHKPAYIPIIPNSINLCGHVHNKWQQLETQHLLQDYHIFNVGVDVWGFKPLKLEDVLKRSKELRS